MTGPLSGVRIVEMEAIGPVPLAAMILSDMGADVVRVGRVGASAGPVLGRGRTVVAADLKNVGERDAVIDLIAGADAVIEGFRPGVMERLGIGPDICHARHPALVFGRMTGWGQTGPLSSRAGHDINYIALTGALHAIGRPGEPPTVPLNLIGDYGGGAMFLVTGVLGGLIAARTSGRGQVIDVAMTEGTATLLSMFHGFASAGRWRDAREANLLDGGAPFYRCYECADGKHVAVGCLEPQFFAACLAGLGFEATEFAQYDEATWPAMRARFEAVFRTRTRDDWAAVFEETDACVSPVLSFAEAPLHPHNVARGSFVASDGVTQAAPAPRFSPDTGAIGEAQTAALADVVARWAERG